MRRKCDYIKVLLFHKKLKKQFSNKIGGRVQRNCMEANIRKVRIRVCWQLIFLLKMKMKKYEGNDIEFRV